MFLTAPVPEMLYGGAAGGGKSFALLSAALQYASVPGYAALLLRRTFADLSLPDALIPLSHQWLRGTGARWSEQRHEWTFPGGGSLTFGYLETENDKYRYQGAAFQFIGFDELTQFTESQYRYLFSRLRRREGLNIPLRMRGATNPGGVGHEWVRARFINGNDPDRLFVPAKLEDNPHLDRAAYEESLRSLDPVTRAQLRKGDWNVRPEGGMFKRAWFDGSIIEERPPFVRVVRYWDLAATEPSDVNPDPDFTAGVLMGETLDGGFVVLDATEFRATPAERNRNIRRKAELDGYGVDVIFEQEPGASGKSQIDDMQRNVLKGFSVFGVRSTGDKITRAKPFSAACENGLVKLFRGLWNENLLGRLTSFGMKGAHDDMTDAAAGAHRALVERDEPWEEGEIQEAFDAPGESLDDERPMTLQEKLTRARERLDPEASTEI